MLVRQREDDREAKQMQQLPERALVRERARARADSSMKRHCPPKPREKRAKYLKTGNFNKTAIIIDT